MVLKTIGLIVFMSLIGGPLLGLVLGTLFTIPSLILRRAPPDGAWMLTVLVAAGVTYVAGRAVLDLSFVAALIAAIVILVTAGPGARRADDMV